MEGQQKIQQMQFLEQNLQAILMQKQTLQMELNENVSALKEIENSEDTIYKVIGQLMISVPKDRTIEDLKNKEKLNSTRLKALEKQEEALQNQVQSLREDVMNSSNNN